MILTVMDADFPDLIKLLFHHMFQPLTFYHHVTYDMNGVIFMIIWKKSMI